jgi:probable F420-dependent oxidoreductase
MQLGKLGVWSSLDSLTAKDSASFARKVEGWGYSALWVPESRGRNVLVHAAFLLASTSRLIVATGIANIYARDPMAAANAQRGLVEQSGGRFLLGLGVSHVPLVEGVRRHEYGKPVATMRAYLDGLAAAPYAAPQPPERPLTVLAALGPKMLELARDKADGAHPYCVTPKHTAQARRILGPGKLLAPEQMVLLETNPAKARAAARVALAHYVALDNYANNWRRLGYVDADMAGGGSDRFIDDNVAWGDASAIRRRIEEHWAAGADHVCIQPLQVDGSRVPEERVLAALAPGGA